MDDIISEKDAIDFMFDGDDLAWAFVDRAYRAWPTYVTIYTPQQSKERSEKSEKITTMNLSNGF